ncbi:hypothetical protein D3C86_2132360 [compost metagenome]
MGQGEVPIAVVTDRQVLAVRDIPLIEDVLEQRILGRTADPRDTFAFEVFKGFD